MCFSSTLLPEPLPPRMTSVSPVSTSRERPRNTRLPPNVFSSRVQRMKGALT